MSGERAYVVDVSDPGGRVEIEHLDGVPWHEAPQPRRFHRCWPQTQGWVNYFDRVRRCPCGAIKGDGTHWMEKNSRRSKR